MARHEPCRTACHELVEWLTRKAKEDRLFGELWGFEKSKRGNEMERLGPGSMKAPGGQQAPRCFVFLWRINGAAIGDWRGLPPKPNEPVILSSRGEEIGCKGLQCLRY